MMMPQASPPAPPAADETSTKDSSFNTTNGDSPMIEDSEHPLDPDHRLAKEKRKKSAPAEAVVTYTEGELSTLIEAYEAYQTILDGKSIKKDAVQERARIWNHIKTLVDNVHGNRRTSYQYRNRLRRLLASTTSEKCQKRDQEKANSPKEVSSPVTSTMDDFWEGDEENSEVVIRNPYCFLCYEEIGGDSGKLSSYLLNLFTKTLSLGLDEATEFQAHVRSSSLCNCCHERMLDYQTTWEQLDLIQKKLSTVAGSIQLSIDTSPLFGVPGQRRARLLKTRHQIRNALDAICNPVKTEIEDGNTKYDRLVMNYQEDESFEFLSEEQNEYGKIAGVDLEETGSSSHASLHDYDSSVLLSSETGKDPVLSRCSVTEKLVLKECRLLLHRCDSPGFKSPPLLPIPTSPIRKRSREGKNSVKSRIQILRSKLRRKRAAHAMKPKEKRQAGPPRTRRRMENTVHKCTVCPYSTFYEYGLQSHHRRVHKNLPLPCPFLCSFPDCQKTFHVKRYLEAHENRFHKGITFYCPRESCTRRAYYTQSRLDKHKLRHDESSRKFPCDKCPSSFYSASQLKTHKNTCHEKSNVLVCEMCSASFTKKPDLEDHQAKVHRTVTPRGVPTCEMCAFEASSRYYLKLHHKIQHFTQELNYRCDETGCSFKTFNASSLRIHAVSHSKERNFACTLCSLTFKRSQSLKFHVESIHQGIRYKCPHCCKEYKEQKKVKRHIAIVHFPQNCPFVCEVCGKSFPIKDYLREHKKRCSRKN